MFKKLHKIMKSGRIYKVVNLIENGKGKQKKTKEITQEQFEDNRDRIFGRKKTPKHGATQVHTDKTKIIPRKAKYDRDYK